MGRQTAEDALEWLARERAGALFGYAYLLSGDRDAAADLVQEGLVRTFSRTRQGFAPDDAERYVRRAICSAFLDGARRRARFARVRHLVASSDDEPAAADPERTATAGADVGPRCCASHPRSVPSRCCAGARTCRSPRSRRG